MDAKFWQRSGLRLLLINAVEHAILQHMPNSKLRSNITRLEREAIKTLKRDKNIVIF